MYMYVSAANDLAFSLATVHTLTHLIKDSKDLIFREVAKFAEDSNLPQKTSIHKGRKHIVYTAVFICSWSLALVLDLPNSPNLTCTKAAYKNVKDVMITETSYNKRLQATLEEAERAPHT